MQSHIKPVTAETSPELTGQSQPKFNKGDFDDAVYDKGYILHIEKALRCPCRIQVNDQPLVDCKNCGGVGWIFTDKKETRGVLQAMNRMVKNAPWTESDRGTVSVSVRDDDKLAFMDRITQTELRSTYSEILRLRRYNDVFVARSLYDIKQIDSVLLFDGSQRKLIRLAEEQYSFSDYVFSVSLDLTGIEDPRVTIRYEHNPQFHVIDITREQVANRGSMNFDGNLQDPISDRLGWLPIHGIARRAHYVLDTPDLAGESLFDNSIQS